MIQYQHGQSALDSRPQQTSLLSLPIELRNAIYKFLVPDDHVQGYWYVPKVGGPPDKRPVRLDKEPCCPAVLRTNRQIYTEVIGMFYGTASFAIYVSDFYCWFLGVQYCTENLNLAIPATLPATFRLVRSLQISIHFSLPWSLYEPPSTDPVLPPLPSPRPGTILIEECLKVAPNSLRQVQLHYLMTTPRRLPWLVRAAVQDHGWQFKVALKKFLDPLRILREIELSFDNIPKVRLHYPEVLGLNPQLSSNEEVRAVVKKLLKLRTRALRQLAQHVSQHD